MARRRCRVSPPDGVARVLGTGPPARPASWVRMAVALASNELRLRPAAARAS